MKERMSRNHKSRENFKVDSLMSLTNKYRVDKNNGTGLGDFDYMTIMYLGFFDKTNTLSNEEQSCDDTARVETILIKISQKKRKDSPSTYMEIVNIFRYNNWINYYLIDIAKILKSLNYIF